MVLYRSANKIDKYIYIQFNRRKRLGNVVTCVRYIVVVIIIIPSTQ